MKKRYIASVLGALMLLLAFGAATAMADSPPGVQTAGQSATNAQQAAAGSEATQTNPSNTNISVRVLSPGNDGPVTQTNSVSSKASAANSNSTDQDASQSQGSGGIQVSDQSAGNAQLAGALSSAKQYGASNTNLPVRVLSQGNAGSVSQSNDASSTASSTNSNDTDQSAKQTQAGGACGCAPAPAPALTADPSSGQSQAGLGSGIQTSDQKAGNEQSAAAASSASQEKPTNTNVDVRVLSSGNDGAVSQTNSVSSDASARNSNDTDQNASQDQSGAGGCGCKSTDPIQTSDQSSWSKQDAGALSIATQEGAKNASSPVRVGSSGNDGVLSQSNSVDSRASARNWNGTDQSVDQDQSGGPGTAIQEADQSANNGQLAAALSAADQKGASNDSSPIRVGSPGGGGSVNQSNSASSSASASNGNRTDQRADQSDPHPPPCGCDGGVGVQVVGQDAASEQVALAGSAAFQTFGKSECGCPSGGNSNGPVRVWSSGDDGSVTQSNSAKSTASARNWNDTDQSADQDQSGGGIAVQGLGQQAKNGQLAGALSAAFQVDPSNDNGPTRVGSPGGGGSVKQSNDASSKASADNWNDTDQTSSQSQKGSSRCGCGGGVLVQALGQSAANGQAALVFSKTAQLKPRNADTPTAVKSSGKGGSSSQTNDDSSNAGARNSAYLEQLARQLQA